MIEKIAIEFDYREKHYKGFFSELSGSGKLIGNSWHLSIYDKGAVYYNGHLSYYEQTGFRFTSQTGEFEDITDFFAQQIMLWYQ